MIICIAGKNDIVVNGTSFMLEQGLVSQENLRVCFNLTDDGRDTFQPSFRRFSKENGLQECQIEELVSIEDLILISLEFDRLIPVNKFVSQSIYNIHFSLLPKYKGMYTSAWPILNGEDHCGVTLHKIDSGIDTGDIIDQIKVEIGSEDTCRDLYLKKMEAGTILFKRNVEKLIRGEYVATPQPQEHSIYYSKKSINYNELTIDLNCTAFQIKTQIRAFYFPEYQAPNVYGYPIKMTEYTNVKSTCKPGTILKNTDNNIVIATIDYNIKLIKDI